MLTELIMGVWQQSFPIVWMSDLCNCRSSLTFEAMGFTVGSHCGSADDIVGLEQEDVKCYFGETEKIENEVWDQV